MESEDAHQQEHVIGICTGPQCSVSGASAALLEIEDLVMEADSGKFRIQEEGCRDFCTVGPNVYSNGSHFSKVQSPEDCDRIAIEIGMISVENSDSTLSTVGKMMRRKANRKRWQLLRSIARQKKCRSQQNRKMEKRATRASWFRAKRCKVVSSQWNRIESKSGEEIATTVAVRGGHVIAVASTSKSNRR